MEEIYRFDDDTVLMRCDHSKVERKKHVLVCLECNSAWANWVIPINLSSNLFIEKRPIDKH